MFIKILEETSSPISGKIQVVSFFGDKRIMVDGLIQSGGLLKGVWQKGLNKFSIFNFQFSNCLILGLGGGTLAKLISQTWPKAKITGVEIDKEMIRLGKKYFNLDKIPNLKIINEDAFEFVKSCQLKVVSFQLIFVDLYLGRKIPEFLENEDFLKNLKKLLAKKGILVINSLFYGEENLKVELFTKKLEKIFPKIFLLRTHSNLLIFLQKD